MLFNSLEFLLLFLPVALASALWTRGTLRLVCISASSAVFYAYTGEVWYLLPLAFSSVLDYKLGSALPGTERQGQRRMLLALSMCGNVGLLVFFKYWGLLLDSARTVGSWFGLWEGVGAGSVTEVLLPAGISFYTFQTMSYTIDVYRGRLAPAKSFLEYLAYVSFFPQLVAGPIARYADLGEQFSRWRDGEERPDWAWGVGLFSVGLCKKVLIADRLANQIDPLIFELGDQGLLVSWLALLGYALQIYFDFSGYSDMALGLGRCFGLKLPQNFHSPYKALNPSDFWKRWHITLSEWIRDYIYISLGGNRGGTARVAANLVVTMGLGGLWHGASWTFVAWGLYHGFLLVLYHLNRAVVDTWHVALQRGLTFLLVTLGWVFFRADDFAHAMTWFEGLFGFRGVEGLEAPYKLGGLVVLGLAVALFAPNAYQTDYGRWPRHRWFALGAVTSLALLLMNYSSTFIYYRF